MSKKSKKPKPPLVSNYQHFQIHYPTKLGTVSSLRKAGTGHTGIGTWEWDEAYKMIAYIIYALPASEEHRRKWIGKLEGFTYWAWKWVANRSLRWLSYSGSAIMSWIHSCLDIQASGTVWLVSGHHVTFLQVATFLLFWIFISDWIYFSPVSACSQDFIVVHPKLLRLEIEAWDGKIAPLICQYDAI